MKLSDSRFDHLLDASSPAIIQDERLIRETVRTAVASYPTRWTPRKRAAVVGSVISGLVLAGTTAAALPSIFDGFGGVDYQSVQEYTVDGRGPFRCEFGFRVDPPVDGVTLEPSSGNSSASFEEIKTFVQTHNWTFDDEPLALTTPADQHAVNRDLGVMSNFISTAWRTELGLAYPNWMEVVGGAADTGQCVNVSDGSAP
jgi:hypothetical protein